MKTDNKQIKASSWVLTALFIISAIVLVLFYCVGFGDEIYSHGKNITSPRYVDVLIVWLYALVAICIGTVLGFGISAGIKNLKVKTTSQRKTGFAGWVFLSTFALIVVSYFLASTNPVVLGDESVEETVWVLKLSDVCLFSIYGLVTVSLVCSVLSMIGVFKARR